jgi:hypothetical protein
MTLMTAGSRQGVIERARFITIISYSTHKFHSRSQITGKAKKPPAGSHISLNFAKFHQFSNPIDNGGGPETPVDPSREPYW